MGRAGCARSGSRQWQPFQAPVALLGSGHRSSTLCWPVGLKAANVSRFETDVRSAPGLDCVRAPRPCRRDNLRSKIQRLSPSGFGAVNTRLRATSRRAAPWALDRGLLRRCRPGTGRCEEVFVGVQLVGPPPEVLETLRLPFAFKQQTGLLAGQQAHACTLDSSQSSLGGP
jgi:hypothetical protein